MKLRVITWTPSRYAKYKECPAKVKYEDLMKLCPVCFKGRLSGGFDGAPVTCDSCNKDQPVREALDRGNLLDAAMTGYLVGTKPAEIVKRALGGKVEPGSVKAQEAARILVEAEENFREATRHPAIEALAKKLRKAKGVITQAYIVLDRAWNRLKEIPEKGIWADRPWARLRLDVLQLTPKYIEIIDWKSGNIKGGEIREKADYHDAMRMYQAAALSIYPQAEARVRMAFLDAPPKLAEPFKSLPVLKRKDLRDAQQKIETQVERMLLDEVFVPRPGFYCTWCPFGATKKGPCKHG